MSKRYADAALMADPNYTAAAAAAETTGHCASSVTMATTHAHHRRHRDGRFELFDDGALDGQALSPGRR